MVGNIFQIGFDDTDSVEGMCTTFLCYHLVKNLLSNSEIKTELIDYPNLIRLNPNIPWKTRGNAALAIRLCTEMTKESLFAICREHLEKFATHPRANSGLVILAGLEIPKEIRHFSNRAMYSVLSISEANELIDRFSLRSFAMRSRQGLVGALAAIGNPLPGDHTFELIAYRSDLSCRRRIDKDRLLEMCRQTFPGTFSSYDGDYDRVMISPHGPDPVYLGIRGETASDVLEAFSLISPMDGITGYMVVRSNQGTGEHLQNWISIANSKAYSSGRLCGRVANVPRVGQGGHVYFTIVNTEGEMDCACYEPTREFRDQALSLIPGDLIEVGGGLRKATSLHSKILNVEYFKPLILETKFKLSNPECPECKITMTSQGTGKGYACRKCGRFDGSSQKTFTTLRRSLDLQLYLPPVKAHRHLTKPLQRHLFVKEKRDDAKCFVQNWIC